MKNLEQILDQYGYGFLTDVYMFVNNLSGNEIAVDEFMNFLGLEREIRRKAELAGLAAEQKWQQEYKEKAPVCQVCNKPLSLESVNTQSSRMIDDHSKSWWVCSDELCESEPITNDKPPEEVLQDLGIDLFVKSPEDIRNKEQRVAKQLTAKRKRAASRQRNCGQRRTP